jgi:hydroxymethylpyrimidine/phosphomethylpyrimidine kinase
MEGAKGVAKLKPTGIYIPPELKKEVQLHCVKTGMTMSEFVVKAIQEKMGKEKEG